jgi:hypothetical protein
MLGKSKTKEKVMISSFRRRDSVSVPIELSWVLNKRQDDG